MTKVIAIDPGPVESAYVIWDGRVLESGNLPNHEMLEKLDRSRTFSSTENTQCAIEQIRGFGVMASDALFDTCLWSGRFLQAFGEWRTTLIPRKVAAAHVCGPGGISKDKFVREALIAKLGPVGTKKQPGPLFGIAGHTWAALAIAVTWQEKYADAPHARIVVESR